MKAKMLCRILLLRVKRCLEKNDRISRLDSRTIKRVNDNSLHKTYYLIEHLDVAFA
jgi:hypothetical protein